MAGERENGPEGARRPVVYCLIPAELAGKLHEPLRRHFRDDLSVEAIVERRDVERRRESRRTGTSAAPAHDRRKIRNVEGRRFADRRAPAVHLDVPVDLPRRARPYADRLTFAERLEPSGLQLEDLDSARTVARFQAGDGEAFPVLYSRYFDRVYAYVRALVRDASEAQDVTQEIFIDVMRGLERFELRDKPFRAWLFRVARNHGMDQLKRTQRLEPTDPAELRLREPSYNDGEESIDAFAWISDRELHMFIDRLPLAQRQVLLLRFMMGLTSAEIAQVTGMDSANVRKQQERAIRFLKARLAAVGRVPRRPGRAGTRTLRRKSAVLRVRRFGLISAAPHR